MKINSEKSFAIVGTSILGINNKEMRQMHEIKERIAQVLNSHKDEKLKNEYLTDDELVLIHAILHVFTKEWSDTQTSAFDDALKELKSHSEKKSHRLPDDDLFGAPDEADNVPI